MKSSESLTYFVAKTRNTPWITSFVDHLNNGHIEVFTLAENAVERYLSYLRPHGRLSNLSDSEFRVLDAVTGLVGVHDSQVQHTVDVESNVV